MDLKFHFVLEYNESETILSTWRRLDHVVVFWRVLRAAKVLHLTFLLVIIVDCQLLRQIN